MMSHQTSTPPADNLSLPLDGVAKDGDGDAGEDARRQVGELIERTRQARPASDADLLLRAYDFAREKHAGQKRRTGEDYIEHPVAVAGILAELGMDDTTIAAGLLHDVPEDCGVTFQEMLTRFGPEVAQLVDGVTKLKHIDFTNEQQKQAENLRKLFLAMAGDVRVIIIKLADRMHNIRTLEPFPEKRRREIAQETLSIFAPIAHRLGIWRVKWELEDFSFKFLEPVIYKQIHALVQRTRAERARLVQRAIEELQARLQQENIQAEVAGRAKHFYSIYQKMVMQGLKFDKIHDLTAIRVICNSTSDCYQALGVVHSLWMQVPEMFFDYIAKPKPNNYQSLHTKVLGPDGELLEVQIRTREMHREAEYGIAAHWRYKSDDNSQRNFGGKLRWLRLVLELQTDTADDAQSFLDSLTLDLAADQVFAFTPRGDVIYLPKGSTPVDFAFRVHSEVGNHCTGAKVNGRIVPLNYKLHNGDICEIVTSRSSRGPKRGWLEFVATPHARNRIKSFLKKQSAAENIREGRMRLEKAARAERLKLGETADNKALLECARALGLKDTDELLAGIGYGEYSAENILNRIRASASPAAKTTSKAGRDGEETLSGAASALLQKRRGRATEENGAQQGNLVFHRPQAGRRSGPDDALPGEMEKGGARTHSNLLYTMAKCCAPIPGDVVRGYVTRGRGVTVHRTDCANLHYYESREPHRLLEAEWTERAGQPCQTLIAIEAIDRVGLLYEVTSVIANHDINISALNTYPLKNKRARLNIALSIKGAAQLEKLIEAVGRIEGVSKAHRI
jgi:GTP pyrophosphokinase